MHGLDAEPRACQQAMQGFRAEMSKVPWQVQAEPVFTEPLKWQAVDIRNRGHQLAAGS